MFSSHTSNSALFGTFAVTFPTIAAGLPCQEAAVTLCGTGASMQ